MHCNINGTVTVCGSRSIEELGNLEDDLKYNLDLFIQSEYKINIGDASGVDYLVQQYLAEVGYPKVNIWYCTEYPRHCQEHQDWPLVQVSGNYTDRDKAMLEDSDELVAIWDNKSKGTKRNIDSFDMDNTLLICQGVNITSRSRGIGGALSINDKAAYKRGLITHKYPVSFKGKDYECAVDIWRDKDAHKPYENGEVKLGLFEPGYILMVDIMKAKFISNPKLWEKVRFRGGEQWLKRCDHLPINKSEWRGYGFDSRYISCLTEAFTQSKAHCLGK